MNIEELTFGVGSILRERVSGWATSQSGTPHVYPDHPPLHIAKSNYPRATVDTISHVSIDQDIEQEMEIGDALVDVTVYAVSSHDVVSLLGDASESITEYHDQNDLSGSPYLDTWSFKETGAVSQIITDQTDEGWTRYNKTLEFEFQHVTTV